MKTIIKNPELFQGEKALKKNKNYFEGWYFKNISGNNAISFIPGINVSDGEKKAFIQIITLDNSYFVDYDINAFKFNNKPFYIKIGSNYFSKDEIHIDIKDDKQNLIIFGNLKYTNVKNIKTNLFSPNIMGPFSYIPFMECNHAILSMKNRVDGKLKINDSKIKFHNGTGYIEKDWGTSFPQKYLWCQGNNFKNKNISFMLSIADIPFKFFYFKGFICSLILNDKEYRFTTYNNAKIIKYDIYDNSINITLKKGFYYLLVKAKLNAELKLIAPIKGEMKKTIFESITSVVNITLKKNKKNVFSDNSINCGLEIVT